MKQIFISVAVAFTIFLFSSGIGPASAQNTSKTYQQQNHKLTHNDLALIANLVQNDATGEPFRAQVGVAAVVLHRIYNREFPNDVIAVVAQLQENPFHGNSKLSDTAEKAVLEAAHGWDPSHGALYYFRANTKHPQLTPTVIIGNVEFYK